MWCDVLCSEWFAWQALPAGLSLKHNCMQHAGKLCSSSSRMHLDPIVPETPLPSMATASKTGGAGMQLGKVQVQIQPSCQRPLQRLMRYIRVALINADRTRKEKGCIGVTDSGGGALVTGARD